MLDEKVALVKFSEIFLEDRKSCHVLINMANKWEPKKEKNQLPDVSTISLDTVRT